MKKIFTILLAFLAFTLCFIPSSASAYEEDKNLLLESQYVKQEFAPDIDLLLEGNIAIRKQRVSSAKNGILEYDENGQVDTSAWANNSISSISLPSDSSGMKIVAWAAGTDTAWEEKTILETAKDFEARNPGWIVMAGVNGDGFQWKGNGAWPSGTHMQDGDAINPTPSLSFGFGENNMPVVGHTTYTANPQLSVKVDGEYQHVAEISSVNGSASEDGVLLITPWGAVISDQYGYKTKTELGGKQTPPINVEGYKVYKCSIDLFRRIYTKDANLDPVEYTKLFARGEVVEVSDGAGTLMGNKDCFYIVAKEGKVNLEVGSEIRCQYELTGQFAGIKNAMGVFGYVLLENGKVSEALQDPTVTVAPRTAIGFKEDGSAVLMVVDGRGVDAQYTASIGLYEAGEFLRMHGCTHGYNLDGGGSATLIYRNDAGNLVVCNTPSDGSVRSVGNALLVVMRDPGISVKNVSDTTAELHQANEIKDATISEFKATVNGTTYEAVDGVIKFEGLSKNRTYEAAYSYKITEADGEINYGYGIKKFTTIPYGLPAITRFEVEADEAAGELEVKYTVSDKDKAIESMYVDVNGEQHAIEGEYGSSTRFSGTLKLEDFVFGGQVEVKLAIVTAKNGEGRRTTYSDVFKLGSELEGKVVVTFDSLGGSAVAKQTIEAGAVATKPADPTLAGHKFVGWKHNGQLYDFTQPVEENITLTAEWEKLPQQASGGCAMGAVLLPVVTAFALAGLLLRRKDQ